MMKIKLRKSLMQYDKKQLILEVNFNVFNKDKS